MWTSFPGNLRTPLRVALLLGALGGCSDRYDTLAPMTAQPKTPVARNITSFTPALQCMDGLLARANRPPLRISSTHIPDNTRTIAVGAEDMLINAVSHMNRRSGAYVFIDQGVVQSSSGQVFQIEKPTTDAKKRPADPSFYISGSISQVDADTRDTSLSSDYDRDYPEPYGRRMGPSNRTAGRSNSIVTVDLHLVAYPSRQVVRGASVSNSMVVTNKTFGTDLTGYITQTTLGMKIKVQRLESRGQAVRNLIELGLIELLGQHAGVPYWSCLSTEGTDARVAGRQERAHVRRSDGDQLHEAQELLVRMGRLPGPASGRSDAPTRQALAAFQAEQSLVAHGRPDFDTLRALRQTAPPPAPEPKATRRKPRPAVAAPKPVTAPAAPPSDDGYRSLGSFLR